MRANTGPVLFTRDSHTYFCRFEICLREFSTVQGEYNYNTTSFTLWQFQVALDTFKHYQTLSDTQWCNLHRQIKPIIVGLQSAMTPFSIVQPVPKIQAVSCSLLRE